MFDVGTGILDVPTAVRRQFGISSGKTPSFRRTVQEAGPYNFIHNRKKGTPLGVP